MNNPSEQKNGMIRLLVDRVRLGLIAAALTVAVPMTIFAQTAESVIGHVLATTKPAVTDADSTSGDNDMETDTLVQAVPPTKPAIPAEVEVEIQNRFNELRRELLDNRADTIDWWLNANAIVLTFFGIVVAIAGYQGFRRFRKLEAETQNYVEKIKERLDKDVQEIQEKVVLVRNLTSEDTNDLDKTERVKEAVLEVQQDPTSSSLDLAVANAVTLQRIGRIEEAIEKWRSIANVAERINNELAARAWFSVGYLFQVGRTEDE